MYKIDELDHGAQVIARQQLRDLWQTYDVDDLLQAGVEAGVIEDDTIFEHRCYEPRYCSYNERCGNVDVWRKPE
jgi:hypothetical protein